MASTATPSFSLPFRAKKVENPMAMRRNRVRVFASGDPGEGEPPFQRKTGTPSADTRIHWEDPDEGWIGGKSEPKEVESKGENLGEKFADLLKNSAGSHYQFLGISTEADLEEIKAAYRRLSKEYHPDTTSLPLKAASDRFMQLKEVYNVLSDEKKRRFYDWTLAQEAVSRETERMKMKLEDPYEQDRKNWESIPDMVDRLGGRNMDLGDQAMSALTFDIVVIIFTICCIIYVVLFKEPY